MKVISDRQALVDAVSLISGVAVSRNATSPVVQCIKLTAADGLLQLAATDLEVGLRMAVEQVDVEEPGEVLIPADKLNQIVRACDDPTLTLSAEGSKTQLHIIGANSHFQVNGFNPEDAPVVRDFGDATVDCELDARVLYRLIHRTLFAAATEQTRYAINGVLFDRDGRKVRFVATDGRRLALATGDCNVREGGDKATCIVPVKALTLLGKLLGDPDGMVRVAIEENQVLFAIGEGPAASVLTSNLVEGAFPPFEDVIPRDQDKRVTFDPVSLSSAIRRAALLTNEESKGVRLSFRDQRLTLHSRAPELGEAEIELVLERYEGDPVEIGFNPNYLVDALKVVDGAEVMIELKAPNKPGVIRTGTDFTYVVMPVSLPG